MRTSSPFKAVALKEALEISKMKPEKGPLVAVQNNQTNISTGAGRDENLLEKLAKASDTFLYGGRDQSGEEVVDVEAEVIYPDDLPVEES